MKVEKYIMANKESLERELIELIDGNLERFLRSTPYSSLGNSNYGTKLTPDMFYNTIYYGDNESEKREKDLKIWFEEKGNNIVIITGYTGCGKTTFVNHFIREYIDMNVVVIDLENKNINLGKTDNDVSLFEYNDENEKKYDSFVFNIKRDRSERISNVIAFKLGLFIYQYIKNNLKTKEFGQQISIIYDDNYDYFDENETIDNSGFNEIFEICKRFSEESYKSRENLKIIKSSILKLDIENMFSILMMIELAKQTIQKKSENVLYCFDNLDIAYEGQQLDEFYSGFLNFIMNWGVGLSNFIYDKNILGEKNIYTSFKFVFCMRETSKSKISEHFKKKTYTIAKSINISEVYDKANIVNKRIGLLEKYGNQLERTLLDFAKIIKELLDDKYNNKNIFPLFNHDYRSSIENLVDICVNNSDLVKEYCEVNEVSYGEKIERRNKYGARGIIFRLLFDIFKDNGYLDKISIFDFNDETHNQKLSVARLILTYLNNRMPINGEDAYKVENAVAINELYIAFDNIIDPKVITDCVYNMYSMRDSRWNHLITYETLCGNSEDHIYKELRAYQKKDKNMEYSKIALTCSGNVYLSIMATHFEFFACRLYGSNQRPLFSKENIEKNNGKYKFESILDDIYKAVRDCCIRIKEFDSQNFLIKYPEDCKYTKFLASEYVYKERRKKRTTAMFHGERILHAHISYLDAYRMFLVNSDKINLIEKKEINKIIIGYINKYITIFKNKNVIYSDKTIGMMKNYLICIKKIKDRNYTDFSTFINVEMTSVEELY